MKRWSPTAAILIALLFVPAHRAAALDLEIELSGGPVFPIGSWGQHLDSGMGLSLGGVWHPSSRIGVGVGLDGELYSSSGREDASLQKLTAMLQGALFLRPGARSFNPGIVVALGLTRSRLQSGTGTDPATWDPSWRAGVRWGFSIGGGFRARIGLDFGSVIASSGDNGDFFDLRLGFLREVSLP